MAVILEDIDDKLIAILEGQESLAGVPEHLLQIDNRLAVIESDVHTIKLVLTDHSGQLVDHESRITKLETPK